MSVEIKKPYLVPPRKKVRTPSAQALFSSTERDHAKYLRSGYRAFMDRGFVMYVKDSVNH